MTGRGTVTGGRAPVRAALPADRGGAASTVSGRRDTDRCDDLRQSPAWPRSSPPPGGHDRPARHRTSSAEPTRSDATPAPGRPRRRARPSVYEIRLCRADGSAGLGSCVGRMPDPGRTRPRSIGDARPWCPTSRTGSVAASCQQRLARCSGWTASANSPAVSPMTSTTFSRSSADSSTSSARRPARRRTGAGGRPHPTSPPAVNAAPP